jgi:hypothetical protein
MRKRIFFTFIILAAALHAKKAPIGHFIDDSQNKEIQAPWLTGPLLAPSGITIPPGHYNIEPYIFAVANTGKYNANWESVPMETSWVNYLQPSLQFGLNKWLDFQINPTLFYNYNQGAAKWDIGDMPIGFDVQIYRSGMKVTDWIIGLKLSFKEVIPMGRYQNLSMAKKGTDIGGQGSWQTGLGFIWGNLFYVGKGHFLTARFAFQYLLPAPVHVKNLNVFGGGAGTHGTAYPAQSFEIDIGTEYTLTKNWALALDIVGNWGGSTRFKGTATGPMTSPPFAQFSLAPAIEYNWNGNLGIIFGPWFTVAGRNSAQFASGVFALNYYH